MVTVQEFTDIYEQVLPPVWRFVASRIPGRQEAQDVTSEVFTRAWQAWTRYDPSRGSPTAWVCGIAQHAIADWWRRHRRGGITWEELVPDDLNGVQIGPLQMGDSPPQPETAVPQAESLAELRRALIDLGEREREALALRFAAGLRMAEIGQILGLSTGATKMMIGRAMLKLKAVLDRQTRMGPLAVDERTANILDEAIGAVLARRRAALPDPLLARLIETLAIVYSPAVPPELPGRVQACISCATTAAESRGGGWTGRLRSLVATFGLPFAPGLTKAVTAPACVVCAAGNAIIAPLTTLGLLGPAVVLHEALWVLGPLNLVVLWRSFQRHHNPAGLLLATTGVLLILLHLYSHTPVFGAIFKGHVVLGSLLLMAGAVIDWLNRRRPAVTVEAGYSLSAP